MTVISIIAAAAECNGKKVIGKNSALPWHLPEDLRRFKQLTLNCPVIMGRKTYDSIGKPLPGRFNIIITRNAALQIGGAQTARSLDDAVNIAKAENPPEIFIIGGAQIYEQAMPIAARMYLTEINCEAEGDVFFPP
ncbi:MAG: dihydrofolate reductase, partial [Gammaproteobacteria bacterium]